MAPIPLVQRQAELRQRVDELRATGREPTPTELLEVINQMLFITDAAVALYCADEERRCAPKQTRNRGPT